MRYLLLLLIISCGKIKVETDIPKNFTAGADFKTASEFCDNRYGYKTKDSEDCFNDYRKYFSPKLSLDLASIESFCKSNYTNETDILGCQTDLLNIIRNSSNNP